MDRYQDCEYYEDLFQLSALDQVKMNFGNKEIPKFYFLKRSYTITHHLFPAVKRNTIMNVLHNLEIKFSKNLKTFRASGEIA